MDVTHGTWLTPGGGLCPHNIPQTAWSSARFVLNFESPTLKKKKKQKKSRNPRQVMWLDHAYSASFGASVNPQLELEDLFWSEPWELGTTCGLGVLVLSSCKRKQVLVRLRCFFGRYRYHMSCWPALAAVSSSFLAFCQYFNFLKMRFIFKLNWTF